MITNSVQWRYCRNLYMNENEETASSLPQGSGPGLFARFFREIWEFAKIIFISLIIVLPIRFFVAQPFIVNGASMEPTFKDGEYLIIDELSYLLRSPGRGEVTVFRYPQDPAKFFIKRIIGLPGETVIIKDGSVVIQNDAHPDGILLEQTYLPLSLETAPNEHTTLGAGEYFVLGDNRLKSFDSRQWGVLGEEFLVGRTFLRLWPIAEVGVITNL